MQRYVIICHLIEGPMGSAVSTVNMEVSRAKVQKRPGSLLPPSLSLTRSLPLALWGGVSQLQATYFCPPHHIPPLPPPVSCDDGEVSLPRRPTKRAGVHKQRVTRRLSRSVTSFTHAVATGLHTCDCVFNLESPETLKDSRDTVEPACVAVA